MQRKRSICKSIAPSTGRSSRPLSPTAFDEVAEDGNNSINYPLMDGRNSTSDFDPETHNPRLDIDVLYLVFNYCIFLQPNRL